MDRSDPDEPDYEELSYTFEIVEPDVSNTDAITLICHPSRRLTMDEYTEALQEFLNRIDIAQTMYDDCQTLH